MTLFRPMLLLEQLPHVTTRQVIEIIKVLYVYSVWLVSGYVRVINVRVSNFHHKVQEVKIIHGLFYFRVLNFRRPRERRKNFNGEYFPIYGILVLNGVDPFQVTCIIIP